MALVRQMAGQLLTALGLWVGVVVLVSVTGVVRLQDTRYAYTTGLQRFAGVFWKWLLVVLVAELALSMVPRARFGDALGPERISRVLSIALGGVGAFFGLLSVIALLNGRDPWEYLPGGPPFALRDFARTHPQFRVETLGFGGTTVAVTYQGTRVIFDETELSESETIWEECGDASEPARLGGPPRYPGAKCLARIQIRRPDYLSMSDEDLDNDRPPPELWTVKYVYSVGWEWTSKVREFYLDWAKRIGPVPNVYGYWMEVEAGGKKWRIIMRERQKQRTVNDVYLEYTEAHAPAGRRP